MLEAKVMSKLESQIRGALYGLLIGDALGVPYEFHDPSDLPPLKSKVYLLYI